MLVVFLSGIDIFHCDFFEMFPASFGDVMIIDDNGKSVSYIDSVERETRKKRIVQLTENVFKIKKVPLYYGKRKRKTK